jgi:hypothetical protein
VLLALVLAGCADNPPAVPAGTTHTPTTLTAAAADLDACKAYLRQEPGDDAKMTDALTHPTPGILTVNTFKSMGDNLESGTATATGSALVTALRGTIAGMRSAQATATAWMGGSLRDLTPDVIATYEASSKVAQICSILDSSSAYTPIGTAQ